MRVLRDERGRVRYFELYARTVALFVLLVGSLLHWLGMPIPQVADLFEQVGRLFSRG